MLVIPDAAEPYSPLPESVVVPVHSSRSMVSCSGLLLCGVHAGAVKHCSQRLAPKAGSAASWGLPEFANLQAVCGSASRTGQQHGATAIRHPKSCSS